MKRLAGGYALVELLTALTLGGLVMAAAAAVLRSQIRMARQTSARTLNHETIRIATQVLHAETRWLNAGRDVHGFAAESLALRALRGSGTVCQLLADGSTIVKFDGIRAPEPDKDSLLVLRDSITENVQELLFAEPVASGCGDDSYRLRTAGVLEPGDVILLFETGSYHLSERALRYRAGRAGRQPLTTESFDAARTFFVPSAAGGTASLRVQTFGQGPSDARIRLPFLNGHQ
jgi:hypothetical protein